jgi:5-methylcytosine-specific restriction endonuclease McrA
MKPNPKPPKAVRLSTRKWKELKDEVWGRDRGVCQLCGHTSMAPDYHHAVFPRDAYPGDVITNVLTLCQPCHWKIHHGNHGSRELEQKAIDKMEEINDKTL